MKSARRTIRAVAVLAGGLMLGAAAMAGGVTLDTNLLRNGGAEKGEGSADGSDVLPVPKWTTEGNFTVVLYGAPDFPAQDSPGPAKRGLNFFAGGPGNALSSMSRTLNLKSLSAEIDAGLLQATLKGYLGGYGSQGDHADVSVIYLDANGAELGTLALQTVTAADRSNQTGLFKRGAVGDVPAGARTARVAVVMTRAEGSYNDGYADALSLVLSTKP